jgi:Cu2+-containing amine oxidase
MKSTGLLAAALVLPALVLFPLLSSGRGQEPAPPDSDKDSTAIFKEMRELEKRQRALIEKLIPDSDTIVMTFPMHPDAEQGGEQTAWKVTWHIDRHTNEARKMNSWFAIKEAWFRTGARKPWLKVLGDCRISELFTPYAAGQPRFLDMKSYEFPIIKLTPRHAGANGRLIGGDRVVAELRDRGPAYNTIPKKGGTSQTRRGQELLLWAVLWAGNYHYLIQYGFQDDGSVTFRCGFTGANFPASKNVPHMHNACWRLHVDLGGEGKNNVYVVRHLEDQARKGKSEHKEELFRDGHEGWLDWEPKEFTRLRIKRAPNADEGESRVIAYDLVPFRHGTSRHYGPNEAYTQHDFWVTPVEPKEEYYYNLPKYVTANDPPRSIKDTRQTLWYTSSMHHEPRLEDGYTQPHPKNGWGGVAQTMWVGFDLRPRGVFSKTPMYP